MDAATYSFFGVRVTARFEVAGLADWLDEALQPAFTREALDDTATEVRVVPRLETDPTQDREPLGRVPCFLFDTNVITHAAWRVGEHVEIADDKYGTRYLVRPTGVDIEATAGDRDARGALLRVVREVVLAHALTNRACGLLHTSAIRQDDNVALFSGPKEAGKTTLAARLAAIEGGAFLANDCTLVAPSPDDSAEWRAHGVPLVVSVRAETVARMPHLFQEIPAIERPARLTIAEADALLARDGPAPEPVRLRLTPAQFARALGAELAGEGRLGCIAFVRVDHSIRTYEIESVDEAEAAARLECAVYGPRGSATGITVFERQLGVHRAPSADAEIVAQIAGDVRCVALRVGPEVITNDDVARALRSELTAE